MNVIQRSPCEFSGKQMGTISEESLADRMMKMDVEPKNPLRSKMMVQIRRIPCRFSE